MKMLPILEMEGAEIKVTKFFFCIFLDNGQCLSEKKPCPKDREDQRCKKVEDAFA